MARSATPKEQNGGGRNHLHGPRRWFDPHLAWVWPNHPRGPRGWFGHPTRPKREREREGKEEEEEEEEEEKGLGFGSWRWPNPPLGLTRVAGHPHWPKFGPKGWLEPPLHLYIYI